MIKAIIFDWGGVLIDNPSSKLIAHCAKHLGVSEKRFMRSEEKFIAEFQKGIIPEDEFWEKVCFELGVLKPRIRSLWGDALRDIFSEKKEIFSLITSLHKNGYKIGFLSNTELPAVNYFEERGYQIFDAVIFSCLEGTRKPERRIYEIALERLGVKPKEAILVDDRKENIKGAKEVGMNGILFKNPDQLKEKLLSFSVKID